jgi:hypothetical protein
MGDPRAQPDDYLWANGCLLLQEEGSALQGELDSMFADSSCRVILPIKSCLGMRG